MIFLFLLIVVFLWAEKRSATLHQEINNQRIIIELSNTKLSNSLVQIQNLENKIKFLQDEKQTNNEIKEFINSEKNNQTLDVANLLTNSANVCINKIMVQSCTDGLLLQKTDGTYVAEITSNGVIKLGTNSYQGPANKIFTNKDQITGNLKSTDGNEKATLNFENKFGEDVNLYWIDYNGNPVLYTTIKPNKTYSQQTFMTHPWVITDQNGNKIGDLLPNIPGKAETIGIEQ